MSIIRVNPLPIMVFKYEEGYFPREGVGYNRFILPSEIQDVICDLTKYCQKYSDEDINSINKEIEEHHFDNFSKTFSKQTKNQKRSGFVYVLSCADKYKVGYSKDVEKRIKQLDTRPFKLSLEYKIYTERAYQLEQEVHKRLEAYREEGEWYSGLTLNTIIETILECKEYV